MNEIISGMKVIKMYTWERPFADLIARTRKKEIVAIRFASLLRAFNLTAYFSTSKLVIFVCFITQVATGGQLNSEAVFVTMAMINIIRVTLMALFSNASMWTAEAWVSCNRIEVMISFYF